MSSSSTSNGWTRTLPACLVIVGAGLLAYSSSLGAPFILDDIAQIRDNPHIRRLWPPWAALALHTNFPPGDRPVVNLSLALNYALDGLNVRGYHAFNIAVHLLAALTLFGVVRRTLARLKDRAATPLAAVVALIWVLHPLSAQAVTYITQRAESLMGLFCLLTLYCFIRAVTSDRRTLWLVLAVGACVFGMGSKPNMVIAPLLVLLYDRVFVGGLLAEILRARWKFYAALAGTWLVLAGLLLSAPGTTGAGFNVAGVGPVGYLLSQFGVVLRYLRLTFWPVHLIFDYRWPVASTVGAIVPQASIVLVLVGLTAWAWWCKRTFGFLAVCFFLILAPSSTFIPNSNLCEEYRMYLPLAALVALVVLGVYWLITRLPHRTVRLIVVLVLTVPLVSVLGFLTFVHNRRYCDPVLIWSDAVAENPQNSRAANSLGLAFAEQGRFAESLPCFAHAVRVSPHHINAWVNWASFLMRLNRYREADTVLRAALAVNPDDATILTESGIQFLRDGNEGDAEVYFRRALQFCWDMPRAHWGLARILVRRGEFKETLDHLREAVRLEPIRPEFLDELAWLLATCPDARFRDGAEALLIAQFACRLTHYRAYHNLDTLAAAYAETGRYDEAVRIASQAVELASAEGDQKSATEIRGRLELFKTGRPYHQPAGPSRSR